MQNKELIYFLLAITLLILPFSSAILIGGGQSGLSIRTINNNTYYINGSNINATSITCASGYFLQSYNNASGSFTCALASGTGSGVANYTLYVSGGSTKNLSLSINDMPNVSVIWNDNTGGDSFAGNYSTYLTLFNWNKTYADTLYSSLADNTSNNNYIASNNDSVKNYILYVNSTNGAGAGSYNDAWINQTIYNKSDVNAINTSMKNYVDSQDSSINNSNNNYIVSYVGTQNSSIVNWANSVFATISNLANYVTHTFLSANYRNVTQQNVIDQFQNDTITSNNQSLNNYILYVNSTNGAGAGSYNDAWINQTIYNKSDVNAINTSMKNYVDSQDSSINTSNNNYIASNNNSVNNNIIASILSNNQSVNNYILYVNSTNGAGSGTDSFVGNYSTFLTHINFATANNGTLVNVSILNNGSYLNPSLTPYMLIANWNSTNTSYLEIKNWNATNTSYLTSASLSPYLLIANWNATNLTYSNWNKTYADTLYSSLADNTSNNNYIISYVGIQNGSLVNYIAVVNTSMKNYVDSQDSSINTSNNNYIASNNASINNGYTAQDNTYNTSNNNYILSNNQSVNNYILADNISQSNWAKSFFYFNLSNFTSIKTTGKLCTWDGATDKFWCNYTDQTSAGGGLTWLDLATAGVSNLTWDFDKLNNVQRIKHSFANYLTNPSFEYWLDGVNADPSGWRTQNSPWVVREASSTHGTYSLNFTTNAQDEQIREIIDAYPYVWYSYSCYYKVRSGTEQINLVGQGEGGAYPEYASSGLDMTIDNNWKSIRLSFMKPADGLTQIRFKIAQSGAGTTNTTIQVDECMLQEGANLSSAYVGNMIDAESSGQIIWANKNFKQNLTADTGAYFVGDGRFLTNLPSTGSGGFTTNQNNNLNTTTLPTFNGVNINWTTGDKCLYFNNDYNKNWSICIQDSGDSFKIIAPTGTVLYKGISSSGSTDEQNGLFRSSYSGAIGLTVKGVTGQTANILDVINSTGESLWNINGTGVENMTRGFIFGNTYYNTPLRTTANFTFNEAQTVHKNITVTNNVTIGQLLNIGLYAVGGLPTNGTAGFCGSPYNGTIMRNSTGVFGCANTMRWKQIF